MNARDCEERLQRFETMLHEPMPLTTEDGKPFDAPVDGSLGLLAVGFRGVIAWRQARSAAARQKSGEDQTEANA